MKDYFYSVADVLQTMLRADEVFTCAFSGEQSDFVRFNKSQIRQAGRVNQRSVRVDLIAGQKHACGTAPLSGCRETDRAVLTKLVDDLRDIRSQLPDDPHLLYSDEVQSTDATGVDRLPAPADAVGEIQRQGDGRDLVGIYASGGQYSGFANSFGQRNWHSTHTFNFDWSVYKRADKAVKNAYAGFEWNSVDFAARTQWTSEQLKVLDHEPKTIKPGRYRVYLTPTALAELVSLLSWGGFGLKAHRTKQTPLIRMVEKGARLHPGVTLTENTRDGIAPNFQSAGFLRPDAVSLIAGGAYDQCLVSPRSAREFGVPTNGAGDQETPASLDLAAGDIDRDDVLSKLGTGVYVSNLWYLNYSDHNACRTTGMTRFATYWVDGGQIVGPLNVMRFDETIYRALGENLVGLTKQRDFLLDATTYGARSSSSDRLPGALIEDFAFTL